MPTDEYLKQYTMEQWEAMPPKKAWEEMSKLPQEERRKLMLAVSNKMHGKLLTQGMVHSLNTIPPNEQF